MTADDPVMLRTSGLGRRFGSLWAIRNMDLEVLRGEVLGLLGPNGTGKNHPDPPALRARAVPASHG
jgi:ABC-type branched-chain amino acid transport systems, ATPase component